MGAEQLTGIQRHPVGVRAAETRFSGQFEDIRSDSSASSSEANKITGDNSKQEATALTRTW